MECSWGLSYYADLSCIEEYRQGLGSLWLLPFLSSQPFQTCWEDFVPLSLLSWGIQSVEQIPLTKDDLNSHFSFLISNGVHMGPHLQVQSCLYERAPDVNACRFCWPRYIFLGREDNSRYSLGFWIRAVQQ